MRGYRRQSGVEKTCIHCGVCKPLASFPQHKASSEGRRATCLECHRSYLLLKKYGITAVEWQAMFSAQGERCAVCRTSVKSARGWATDHDHKTGAVRGILCNGCNVGIGAIGDTAESVAAALAYLQPPVEAVEEHW